MRIGVDARTIYAGSRRGTGKNLIDLYSTLAHQKADWEFCMFHQIEGRDNPFEAYANVSHHQVDIPGDRWNVWQDLRLPLAARGARVHVLHCPANTAPLKSLTPIVLSVHDLIPLEIAPNARSTIRWLRRVRRSAQLARRIITPSLYSRTAIIEHLGVPAEKVTVNYWAPDRKCRRVDHREHLASIRTKYGIPSGAPYLLAFGGADPRKNTRTILEAWRRLASSLREQAALVVVGLQPEALAAYRAETTDPHCLLHGFADEADIPALLTGAQGLCYPSRSEGFGLPVLDAFACGTPVITSNTTSLPEVAGSAALLVRPDDADAIAAAMSKVLASSELRSQLRQAGYERVAAFSWDRCARTVADLLQQAAAA